MADNSPPDSLRAPEGLGFFPSSRGCLPAGGRQAAARLFRALSEDRRSQIAQSRNREIAQWVGGRLRRRAVALFVLFAGAAGAGVVASYLGFAAAYRLR